MVFSKTVSPVIAELLDDLRNLYFSKMYYSHS